MSEGNSTHPPVRGRLAARPTVSQHPPSSSPHPATDDSQQLPAYHRKIFCHRAHPLDTLANTTRAYATLPSYCGGVTAQLQISNDAGDPGNCVPFLSHEKTMKRYNDPRNAEDLSWADIQWLQNNSNLQQEAHFLRFSDFLAELDRPQNRNVTALVDIKSKRPADVVVAAIRRELLAYTTSVTSTNCTTRLIFCLSTELDIGPFRRDLRDCRIAVNCKTLWEAYLVYPWADVKVSRKALLCKEGREFVAKVHSLQRQVYVEKVDDEGK